MAIKVNTTEAMPIKVGVTVGGVALDEAGARKLAMCVRDSVASHFGMYGDEQRESIEVALSADGAPVADKAEADEPDPETPEPESETEVVKATEDEIAAMTPEQYRKAKAAGQI